MNHRSALMRHLLPLLLMSTLGSPGAAHAAEAWPVVGRQGLVQVVVVPTALATQREAYVAQVALLCPPETTCFVNFYTNSTDAPVGLPLPDAIEREVTATFRRSSKNGSERFQWACRMKQGNDPCF